jgi:pimeloyl-ACP methyl ester carboxylesterase
VTRRPPIPIEIALPSGVTLRGLEYPEDGPPVLFVHDLGADLDAWGSIPADVAAHGFRVVSLDLRGHGLSDGEPDGATTLEDVKAALAVVTGTFGPTGLVAYGGVAEVAFALSDDDGAPVHIVVSPAPLPGAAIDRTDTRAAMRALFVGANDEYAAGYVRRIYPKLRGQNMWFSTGTTDQGVALLTNFPHLVEQLCLFLRRYLTGFHLSWIATQREDEPNAKGGETASPPA